METKSTLRENNIFWMRFLFIVAFSLMALSFLFSSSLEVFQGLKRIITSKSILLTDYMEVGNVGSAFFNAGLCTLVACLVVKFSKADISSVVVAGVLNLTAFCFLGKNIYNIFAPMFGAYLFSRFKKEAFKDYVAFALFATGIGPLISYMTFEADLPIIAGILLGNFLGMLIGFFLPAVSKNSWNLHQGFTIYNNGFALGIIYVIFHSVMKMFGLAVENIHLIYMEENLRLFLVFIFMFVGLMVPKLIYSRSGFAEILAINKESGKSPCNYIGKYENYAILFNMGLVGLMGLCYLKIVGANINGINLGGVCAVVAFALYGINPRNILPIFLGVFLAGHLGHYVVNSESVVIAALFGTTLAPLAGYYGPLAGVIAGFFHLSLVSKTGLLHDGFHLYNNGFASGLVASLLFPIFEALRTRKFKKIK